MTRVAAVLDRVRAAVPPVWRERLYNGVGVAVTVLGGLGVVDDNAAAVVAQLVLAVVTLAFAVLHSTSSVRTAVYLVLAATQGVLGLWSLGDGPVWSAVLSIAAAVLGTQIASGRTPAPYDNVLGRHRERYL